MSSSQIFGPPFYTIRNKCYSLYIRKENYKLYWHFCRIIASLSSCVSLRLSFCYQKFSCFNGNIFFQSQCLSSHMTNQCTMFANCNLVSLQGSISAIESSWNLTNYICAQHKRGDFNFHIDTASDDRYPCLTVREKIDSSWNKNFSSVLNQTCIYNFDLTHDWFMILNWIWNLWTTWTIHVYKEFKMASNISMLINNSLQKIVHTLYNDLVTRLNSRTQKKKKWK